MDTRIEAGAITESCGVYSRYVVILRDNDVIFGERLRSRDKEELKIIDREDD